MATVNYGRRIPQYRRWPTWPPTTCTAPQVIGHCAPSAGIGPFSPFRQGDDSPALRLSTAGVLDRRQQRLQPRRTAAARPREAFPNARMIHLPVHASWLSRIEIYFSVVQ